MEYVNHIRENAGKRFAHAGKKKDVNYDIEQNVREIRALLKINAEIFSRCIKAADLPHREDGVDGTLQFTRSTLDEVKVRQNRSRGSEEDEDDDDNDDDARRKTEFVVEESISRKMFGIKPLTELPANLRNVFVVQYKAEPLNTFIDHDAFFQSALMLHEDVLEPFLAKLKHHIESIHVCLGEIESWLLEPKSNIEFLEETFELELELLGNGDLENDSYEELRPDDTCRACDRRYDSHPFYCTETGDFFERKRCHVLKLCNDSGKHERKFAITSQSDRHKMKKFLEFLAD
jgi:hypothetical protein